MSGSRPNLTGYRRFGIMGLLLAVLAVLAATGLNHPPALAMQSGSTDNGPALAIQGGTPVSGPALAIQAGTPASGPALAIQSGSPDSGPALAIQDDAPASEPAQAIQGDPSAGRPNIIVIMSDDQGWNDIGYHGSEILTPNLDRLAKEGVRFSQFYAYSTCSPSRVALLTGQHPAALGVFGPLGETTEVQPKDVLLPFGLQEAGYSTHISGKWHIGDRPEHRPLRHGFTTSYDYLRGQIDPWTHRYKFGDYVTWHRNDHYIEETGHVTELITDRSD